MEITFLIDLERETAKRESGPATKFLLAHADTCPCISFISCGELASGLPASGRQRWDDFLRPFHVLPWTMEVAWNYGRIYRHLQQNGALIGANDLWIAATAVSVAMPVVTRNLSHFQRVPDLEVSTY